MQQAITASRRLEERFDAAGATATINGKTYPVRDWNSRGLAIVDYEGRHERGERLRVTVQAPASYGGGTFETGLFVVRYDRERQLLAGVYVSYERETAQLLGRLFPE